MELFCFSCTGNSLRAAETARQACADAPLFLAVFPVHAQTRTLRLRTPVPRWYWKHGVQKAKEPAFYL